MALPLPPGLVPTEVAFLCEMEMVTIVPRQRLESMPLLSVQHHPHPRHPFLPIPHTPWMMDGLRGTECPGHESDGDVDDHGPTPALRPPHRAELPLWLALLLKRQRRANILAPPWLHPASLQDIINHETKVDPEVFSPPPPPPMRPDGRGGLRPYSYAHASTTTATDAPTTTTTPPTTTTALSPPFLPSCTQAAPSGYLPYHWLELAEALLAHAADDVPSAAEVRALLRDLQEVRAAKLRAGTSQLDDGGGGVVGLRGVGAMELAENRAFVLGVVDGVRKLGASAEASRREEEEEEEEGDEEEDDERGGVGGGYSDDEMEL
ncbi:hypothetical protein DL766_008971 [Monosporascus sp. MC13-8B]|nr:hypothetical protein DL763_008769 [Monosporascus cannonballus]RYP17186.1 hypothetical protein DL766_008971 [Monosporascus sp. MC13-8B]